MDKRIIIEGELPQFILSKDLPRNRIQLLPDGYISAHYDGTGTQVITKAIVGHEHRSESVPDSQRSAHFAVTDTVVHQCPMLDSNHERWPTLTTYHDDGTVQFYEAEEKRSWKMEDVGYNSLFKDSPTCVLYSDTENVFCVIRGTSCIMYSKTERKIVPIGDMLIKRTVDLQTSMCKIKSPLVLIVGIKTAFISNGLTTDGEQVELKASPSGMWLATAWYDQSLRMVDTNCIACLETQSMYQASTGQNQKSIRIYPTVITAEDHRKIVSLALPAVASFIDRHLIYIIDARGGITSYDYQTASKVHQLNRIEGTYDEDNGVITIKTRREGEKLWAFVLRRDRTLTVYDAEGDEKEPIKVYYTAEVLSDIMLDGEMNVFGASQVCYPLAFLYYWKVKIQKRNPESNTQSITQAELWKDFYSTGESCIRKHFLAIEETPSEHKRSDEYQVEDHTESDIIGVDLTTYSLSHREQARMPSILYHTFRRIYHEGVNVMEIFGILVQEQFMFHPLSVLNSGDVDLLYKQNVGSMGEAIKIWLSSLSEPIVSSSLYKDFMTIADTPGASRFEKIENELAKLPAVNRFLFDVLTITLYHMVTPSKLGLLFGPLLLCKQQQRARAQLHMPKLALLGRVFIEEIGKFTSERHKRENYNESGETASYSPIMLNVDELKDDTKYYPTDIPINRVIDTTPKVFVPQVHPADRGQISAEMIESRNKDLQEKQQRKDEMLRAERARREQIKAMEEQKKVIEEQRKKMEEERRQMEEQKRAREEAEERERTKMDAEKRAKLEKLVSEMASLFGKKLQFIQSKLTKITSIELANSVMDQVYQVKVLVLDLKQTESSWTPTADLKGKIDQHLSNPSPSSEKEAEDLVYIRSGVESYVSAILKKFEGYNQGLDGRSQEELIQMAQLVARVQKILVQN
ncbi:hypothetical protein PROFUN_09174 [Planoprotostelium fungivorum]|uniref:Rho-GAP domain-containing protein n=1 Tax=Planoprotostelium fungivorum TaxID=1890364 RepID=A0A2P6MVL1_9EUKA|nr:hypothetical protein PROFUN_09174 [Planoprotostelium fungivorum]